MRNEKEAGPTAQQDEQPLSLPSIPVGSEHRVLIPVEVLRGESIATSLIETFASVPVVLLGYHELPEQTAPGQARMQFEEKASDTLEEYVEAFEDAGGHVTSRLVFTHNTIKTIERTAVELNCDSILLLNPAPRLQDIFVPIRGDVNVTHIARLVGHLTATTDAQITLFHATPTEDGRAAGEGLLEAAAHTLETTGVSRDRVSIEVTVSDKALALIFEAADDYDMVVFGETKPSVRGVIFGTTDKRLAAQSVCPVLVVRRHYLESEEGKPIPPETRE